MKANPKIFSSARLAKKIGYLKKKHKKVVFTNGCFDLLHVGHVRLLKKARTLGDRLVVALNNDASVKKIKGKTRPIVPLKERLEIVSALEAVDFVTSFGEETPEKIIKLLKPDVLVKGGDYKIHQVVGARDVQKNGGRIVILTFVKGKSTSGLLEKIKND